MHVPVCAQIGYCFLPPKIYNVRDIFFFYYYYYYFTIGCEIGWFAIDACLHQHVPLVGST